MNNNMNNIPAARRDKILRVLDGDQRLLPLAFLINKAKRSDEMLDWLLLNRITGVNLVSWFHIENEGSFLYACQDIIRRLEREIEHRPLIMGDDIK